MSKTSSDGSPEKAATKPDDSSVDQGNQALILDVAAASKPATGLQLAKDGHTILIPQPTSSPSDPLNWTSFKKHMILFIVALSAIVGDFASGAGIPCTTLQGIEWNLSPNRVNYATNLNVLMVGIGGLVWIPFIYFWGRAPVLFWTTVVGTVFTLVCCVAGSFETFYAARAIVGLTLTAGQVIGLAFIKDMFFFHEHARKIGLWVVLFFSAVYVGPLVSNFMIDGLGEWRPVFWLVFALCCLDLVLITLSVDETWYRRDVSPEKQPGRRGRDRLLRVIGWWQIQHHEYFLPVGRSFHRLLVVFLKPIIIPCMLYYAASFMWAVGINLTSAILFATPVEAGGYGYSLKGIGFLHFTPIVGVALGEAFGHFFNDWIAYRYARKHKGVFRPEARLWVNYIGVPFMITGLILVGQALEKRLNVGAIIMGWGAYVFGVMIASVGITAYVLDSYPNGSGEVSAFMNFARTVSGFTVGYFQQPWGAKSGYGTVFGIQAAVVAAAVIILIGIHVFGERLRQKGGTLKV